MTDWRFWVFLVASTIAYGTSPTWLAWLPGTSWYRDRKKWDAYFAEMDCRAARRGVAGESAAGLERIAEQLAALPYPPE